VDYNPPVVADGALNGRLDSVAQSSLRDAYARGDTGFSLAVFFSGMEHDGLGRYGDPIDPNGDVSALRELFLSVAPGGFMLLGIPTCERDTLFYPMHRIYGPTRLQHVLNSSGFQMIGRVWDGKVVTGGLEMAERSPTLWKTGCHGSTSWKHQPVLVLQKPRAAADADYRHHRAEMSAAAEVEVRKCAKVDPVRARAGFCGQ